MDKVLDTERMELRRFTPADLELLVALHGDAEVMRFVTGKATPPDAVANESLPRILGHYTTFPQLGVFAAFRREDAAFLGWFEFVPPDAEQPHDVELGYRLHRWAWGKGYATEGALALLDRGFAEWGVERVHAGAMAVNTGSRRVLEKAGLRFVRAFHEQWADPIPGAEHGEVEYALTREQWARR